MQIHPQIEPSSTARLLTCLGFAIDETKLISSIKRSKESIRQLETADPSSHRLLFLRKEILNLEAKLAEIRGEANVMKTATGAAEN